MEQNYAHKLIAELTKRGDIPLSSPIDLAKQLYDVEVPENEFSIDVVTNPDVVEGSDMYQFVKVTKVIRNNRASLFLPGQKTLSAILFALGLNQEDPMIRIIRSDLQIIYAMHASAFPYSLILNHKISDQGVPNWTEFNKPLLIIPGVSSSSQNYIRKWEDSLKTRYYDSGVIGH